jgi:hypothetical protein
MRLGKHHDGNDYLEYVLLYVDDFLVIGVIAEQIPRKEIGRYFEMKEESIVPPTLYLDARTRKVELDNGVNAWSICASQYIRTVCGEKCGFVNIQDELKASFK